jgi:hypothetical protein
VENATTMIAEANETIDHRQGGREVLCN